MNNKVNSVLNSIEKIDHLVMEADVSVSDAMNDVYNKQFKMKGNITEDYINHEYYQESVIAGILIGGGIIAVLATAIVLITKHVKKSASGDPEKKDDKSTAAGTALDNPNEVKKKVEQIKSELTKVGGSVEINTNGIDTDKLKQKFDLVEKLCDSAEGFLKETEDDAIQAEMEKFTKLLEEINNVKYESSGNISISADSLDGIVGLAAPIATMTAKLNKTAEELTKRAKENKNKGENETDSDKKEQYERLKEGLEKINKGSTELSKSLDVDLKAIRTYLDEISKAATEKNKSSEAEKAKTDDSKGKTDNSETNNISPEDTKSIAGFTHNFMMNGYNKSGPGTMSEEDIKKILNELVSASKTKTGDDFDDEIRRLFTAQENDEFKHIYLDLVVRASNDLLGGKVNVDFVKELNNSIGTGKDIKLSNLGDMDSVDGSGKGSPLPVIVNNRKKDTSDMDSILPPITKDPAEILNKVIQNNPNYKQFENNSDLIDKIIPSLSKADYDTLINKVNAVMSNVKYPIIDKAIICDIAKEIATERGWTDKLDNFKLSEDAQKELDQYLKTTNTTESEDTTKKDKPESNSGESTKKLTISREGESLYDLINSGSSFSWFKNACNNTGLITGPINRSYEEELSLTNTGRTTGMANKFEITLGSKDEKELINNFEAFLDNILNNPEMFKKIPENYRKKLIDAINMFLIRNDDAVHDINLDYDNFGWANIQNKFRDLKGKYIGSENTEETKPEKQTPQTNTLRWLFEDPDAAINYANNDLRPDGRAEIPNHMIRNLKKLIGYNMIEVLSKYYDDSGNSIDFNTEMNWSDIVQIYYDVDDLVSVYESRDDINGYLKKQYLDKSNNDYFKNKYFQMAKAYVELHGGPNELLRPDGTKVQVTSAKSEDTTKKDKPEHTNTDRQTSDTGYMLNTNSGFHGEISDLKNPENFNKITVSEEVFKNRINELIETFGYPNNVEFTDKFYVDEFIGEIKMVLSALSNHISLLKSCSSESMKFLDLMEDFITGITVPTDDTEANNDLNDIRNIIDNIKSTIGAEHQTDGTNPDAKNNITSEQDQDEKFEELRQKITANLKNKYPSGCNVISLYSFDIEEIVTVILGMCMSNKSEQEIQSTVNEMIFGFIKSTLAPAFNNVRYAIPNKKFKDQPVEYQNALNALINAVNISIDEASKITGNSYTIDTRKYTYDLTGNFFKKTILPHADLKEVMTDIENKFGQTQQQPQTSNDTQPENTNQNTDSDTSNLSGLARLKDHIQVPDIVKEVNQLDEPGVKEISKSDMQELQKASAEKLIPFIEKGMEIFYHDGNSYKLDSMPLSRKNVRLISSFAGIINQIYDADTDLDAFLTQKYSKDMNQKLKDFYYQMAKLYAQEMNIHVVLTDPNGKKEEINATPVFK